MSPPGRIADTSANTSDLVAEFSAAAFDSAIQRPINGLTQLGGKLIGHELPQLHLVDLAKPATSGEMFAQQAGAAVGMLVPYLGTRALVRGAAGSRLGTGYGAVALEGGATGFLMGAVLTPVDNNQPFWVSRMANGFTDAGTFVVLNVAGKGISSTKALSITSETPLVGRIGRGALSGAVSGLPAGFAHAELNSMTHGNGFARAPEISGDMAGFAIFGGLLGGAVGARAPSRFRPIVEGEAKGKSIFASRIETADVKTNGGVESKIVATPLAMDTTASPGGTGLIPVRKANIVEARREIRLGEAADRPGAAEAGEKILKVKKSGYIDAGDEGSVYSNGDGSVTKVYADTGRSMEAVKAIFDKLNSIGIKTPKILEYGKTEEGLPAMRMEQIGDGDNLRFQMISGEIRGADLASLRQQYYAYADALKDAGIRIDWNTKNMRFQDGKLYILDPSFLKNEPMSDLTVNMFVGLIGPRP
jgi:hypothetical protein